MSYFRYDKELTVYRRRLPHWRMEGGVYFVTARLADAVPSMKARRLRTRYREEVARLQKKNVSTEVFDELFEWYHLDQLDGVLDEGHGECALGREEVAEVLWASLQHFDGVRYQLIAAVIMPNHIHVVFRVLKGFSFEKIVGGWKSYTYTQVRKRYGLHLKWQEECFDRLVRDPEELLRVTDYVLRNPRDAGLRDWPWVARFMSLR